MENLIQEYAKAYQQVVRWVAAGGIAGFTVDLLDSGANTSDVVLILLIASFPLAFALIPLQLASNETYHCPYCSIPFQIGDALDAKKYENHVIECAENTTQ